LSGDIAFDSSITFVTAQDVLTDFDKADDDARRMAASLSDAQINWHPAPNAWSIGQCLDHLAQGNALYAAALGQAVRAAHAGNEPWEGQLRPGWMSERFIRALEPPVRTKMKAPKKIIPVPAVSGRDVLEAFLRSQADLRDVLRSASRVDLNRVRFKNPFFGFLRFTVGAGFLIITAHARRHLWQAQRVIESPGFPKN
jgi:hypothetical protein